MYTHSPKDPIAGFQPCFRRQERCCLRQGCLLCSRLPLFMLHRLQPTVRFPLFCLPTLFDQALISLTCGCCGLTRTGTVLGFSECLPVVSLLEIGASATTASSPPMSSRATTCSTARLITSMTRRSSLSTTTHRPTQSVSAPLLSSVVSVEESEACYWYLCL